MSVLINAQTSMELIATITSPIYSLSNLRYCTVDGNGDINNDGYKDIIFAGNPLSGADNSYKVYIYFGGDTLNDQPDMILNSPNPYNGASFGLQIAYNNDINGDGIDDLVVGDPYAGNFSHGYVYVYFGSIDFDDIPDFILNGMNFSNPSHLMMGCPRTSGDFNGDGYKDLAVTCFGLGIGRAYIFFGGPLLDDVYDWSYQSLIVDYLGDYAAIGDINNDGYDDILLTTFDGNQTIYAKIYFGGINMDNTPDWQQSFFNLNISFKQMDRDVNDDGCDDLISYCHMIGVQALWGNETLGNTLDTILSIPYSTGNAFYPVFHDQLYIALPNYLSNRIEFYRYNPDNGIFQDYIINQPYNSYLACKFYSYLGDINNDGRDEILVPTWDQTTTLFNIYTEPPVYNRDESQPPHIITINCYPNPVKDDVIVSINSKQSGYIALDVFNIRGQKVKSLFQGLMKCGESTFIWNGKDEKSNRVATGIYILNYRSKSHNVNIHKMLILY